MTGHFLLINYLRQDNLRKERIMNKKLKKGISAALICAMLATTTATALNVTAYDDVTTTAAAKKSYSIAKKSVTMYCGSADVKAKEDLYFVNGSETPYMDVSTLFSLLKNNYNNTLLLPEYDVNITKNGDKITVTRETGYKCVIDFAEDTIFFDDYNEFNKRAADRALIDLMNIPDKDEGKPFLLKRHSDRFNERYGDSVTLDLGSYGIDLVRKGNTYLMPIQTFSDIFGREGAFFLIYTGKKLFLAYNTSAFIDDHNNLTDYGKLYYKSAGTAKLSKEYAKFNYNELCFALDHFYGLKSIHNIESFNELFHSTGLDTLFLSGDPKKIDTAIYILITRYIDDGHTSFKSSGYASGSDYSTKLMKNFGQGYQTENMIEIYKKILASRAKFYPEGVPGYEEVGDTAFITFDGFSLTRTDFYTNGTTNDASDTINLMSYSVQQILRKDSPVKNVVLDLSANLGGALDTAIYTVAAILGKAAISVQDSMTGALVTAEYVADTNLDRKFNSKDYLAGKGIKLFCLESGVSFSCGNLVPNILKQSSDVAVIGQTSGGGSCTVGNLCTANGTMFNISSTQRMSFMKNGSFYDIDLGAAPDFTIYDLENFADRNKIVEFIHGLI